MQHASFRRACCSFQGTSRLTVALLFDGRSNVNRGCVGATSITTDNPDDSPTSAAVTWGASSASSRTIPRVLIVVVHDFFGCSRRQRSRLVPGQDFEMCTSVQQELSRTSTSWRVPVGRFGFRHGQDTVYLREGRC